ncbi:hypothetical protein CEXT_13081 [Caerostris extrusa]|uniref:Uncharacterized protein n=1 Tax=Caerostris extrusa TaxID=172846 RepID=A0AAV4VBW0_CAEEX|nr:hypothetical protein CEXT_13081 [Caerostris extrusa]
MKIATCIQGTGDESRRHTLNGREKFHQTIFQSRCTPFFDDHPPLVTQWKRSNICPWTGKLICKAINFNKKQLLHLGGEAPCLLVAFLLCCNPPPFLSFSFHPSPLAQVFSLFAHNVHERQDWFRGPPVWRFICKWGRGPI